MADAVAVAGAEVGTRSPSHAHVPELDGMRGIAIAMVVALHFFVGPRLPFWQYWAGAPIANLLRALWCGVDLFFVLSGFLIGGIILDQRSNPRFFGAFYARRTTRIFPLYFALIALAFCPGAPIGIHPSTGTMPLLAYLTFTANLVASAGGKSAHGLAQLWSICIEEQFYLFAPLLLRALSARFILPALVAVVVASAGLRTAMSSGLLFVPLSASFWTPSRLDGLALGVIAAWLVREPRFVVWAQARTRWLGTGFVVLMLVSAAFTQLPKPWLGGPGVLCISLTAGWAVVWMRLCSETWLTRALRVKPLVELGRYSYFIYLFHSPARWALHDILSGQMSDHIQIMFVDACLLLLLCALASWSLRYFEVPLISWGRRIDYGARPGSSVPSTLS